MPMLPLLVNGRDPIATDGGWFTDATLVFNQNTFIAYDPATGFMTPVNSSTIATDLVVAGLQTSLTFTSAADNSSVVLWDQGGFRTLNGTSGDAIATSGVGGICYLANDGITACSNDGSSTRPILGLVIGLADNGLTVIVEVIPSQNLQFSTGASNGDMLLGSVQTVTAAKTFNNGKLVLRNAADTFSTTLEALATANRVISLPDVTATLAQAAVASAADSAWVRPTPTTSVHGTWTAQSGTTPGNYAITSGGPTAAAGSLIGGAIFDTSGNGGQIIDNTAITASSGTIYVAGVGIGTPATATTLIIYAPATHTHVQT